MSDSEVSRDLMEQARAGSDSALNELIGRHRGYVRRIVDLRLEPAMRGRVDPSDIVQEAQLLAAKRFPEFATRENVSFRLWLRGQALNLLVDQRRRHYAQKRSIHREVHLSNASSMMIARRLLQGTPSQLAARREIADHVRNTLFEMKDKDREVLLLRYVEGLSNGEVAELLNLDPDTASRRHGRALRRLCQRLNAKGIVQAD